MENPEAKGVSEGTLVVSVCVSHILETRGTQDKPNHMLSLNRIYHSIPQD